MREMAKVIGIMLLLFTMVCGLWTINYAAVPHLLNYQGRLTDKQGKPLEGNYNITFKIFDQESAGILLCEETHSNVSIQKGLFSVMLGAGTPVSGSKFADLSFDKPYFLEIKVGNEVMSARQQITSSGYAIRAEVGEKIKADSTDIAPGYLSDKVDNSTIQINASDKLEIRDAGISVSKISGVLGFSNSKSVNTVYQAATDGFVVAYSNRYGGWGAIYGYADSGNPPNTKIADNNGRPDEQEQNVFICFPVKKGNYWKVALDGNASSATITWIPLGS